jgi:hypothetical protein
VLDYQRTPVLAINQQLLINNLEPNPMKLQDLQMESITGESISFSDFKDQALLIVNLASQ